tara:strand:+ start:73 stop:303 length:231 start_codon:yes stop_codon:yes gene_type:complete
MMVFDSNPFEPVIFYKVHPVLYLSGQLKLFHIYPVNMEQPKEVSKNGRSQLKLLTTKNGGEAVALPPKRYRKSRYF